MADQLNRDPNAGRSTSTSPGNSGLTGTEDWNAHRDYWRTNFASRPYASADRNYEWFEPAYRYGHDSAIRHRGRQWNDVEPELRSGWDRYEHRGANQSKWDEIKAAVRDAWDRVTGKGSSR